MKGCQFILHTLKNGSIVTVCVLLIGLILSLQGFLSNLFLSSDRKLVISQQQETTCEYGNFILKRMGSCHPWLTCNDIEQNLTVTDEYLGTGVEKIVKEGFWQGHPVAVNILKHKRFFSDFQHNLDMLQLFSKEPGAKVNKIVQLVGWCFQHVPVIITEKHPLGAANNVHAVLKNIFPLNDTLAFRFGLCKEFVHILDILHSHTDGPRVLCDANKPNKAMSQFLLSENMSLILNDMDALPLVNRGSGELIKCGHRELYGDYVSPEQLWPYETEYNDNLMPHYDEKVDIWKIPDICNFLLGRMPGGGRLQLQLFHIHSQCKDKDPKRRPTAKAVLSHYETIEQKLGWNPD